MALPDEETGILAGTVTDRDTGEPVAFAYLHLEEINRTVTAHSDGSFEFTNVPTGSYTLSVYRVGYQTISQTVRVAENETTEIAVSLRPTVLNSEAVEVIATDERGTGSSLEHASKTISGTELRQDLGTTLASTLDEVPGFSSRTMGSAPGRPVVRGLGGERLLILQDGERTGDVSGQSADHAVTVDPMSAEKIEIARGPAALQYGSNAIGGVINIVRNQIATSQPDHLHGSASLQGESVNTGAVAGLEASAPLGKTLALKLDGNLRSARNTATPEGKLENSGILSTNNALGLSYIRPWGYAGLASSVYFNNYGIPPNPEGGHPQGVDIEMRKYQSEAGSEVFLNNSTFKSIKADISYKNYYHREIEASGDIGTEFGVLTGNASVFARHGTLAFFDSGKMGLWGEAKNYAIQGARTPDSDSYSLAGYIIEEKDVGALHLELGARFDYVETTPAQRDPDSQIGFIRERSFSALASSATAIYDLGNGFFTGTTWIHSFRAPSQEELYSEGPHLASYSYEVGNPDLDPERGLGKELFFRYKTSTTTTELSFYHNSFDSYIYPRNTGQPSARFPSLNVYQFTGVDALFQGVEASSQVQLLDFWALSGSLSYTHASRKLNNQEPGAEAGATWHPLPMIPPFKGSLGLKYAKGGFQVGSNLRLAARQTRTGDFETPTEGYAVIDLFGQYRLQSGAVLHTFSLNAENILDTTYRKHLSRIKEIRPEAGFGVSLLYRIYF
ncbi:TonB-dependent receptor [Halalkalibaculum sp. DA3122]|uniref:TonB-dependent receptor n=1 Tax=Halalkalibaculum sp. DA3122 TaxID=3373607 RepID=UPI003754F404